VSKVQLFREILKTDADFAAGICLCAFDCVFAKVALSDSGFCRLPILAKRGQEVKEETTALVSEDVFFYFGAVFAFVDWSTSWTSSTTTAITTRKAPFSGWGCPQLFAWLGFGLFCSYSFRFGFCFDLGLRDLLPKIIVSVIVCVTKRLYNLESSQPEIQQVIHMPLIKWTLNSLFKVA